MRFIVRLFFRIAIVVILLDMLYIAWLWFARDLTGDGKIPQSSFMQSYIEDTKAKQYLPKMRWKPLSISNIPEKVVRVFVIAEDTHFYVHNGFDFQAIRAVLAESFSQKSISRGASTISQQTAKNLFLYPSRSWLRKWHEMIFTILLELTMDKNRILELYLNVVELGLGVYGVNAAAYYYFGIPVASINTRQAAYIAAVLPWPQKHNLKTGTKTFHKHADRIYKRSLKESIPQ